jgi:hypothetical protein
VATAAAVVAAAGVARAATTNKWEPVPAGSFTT